MSEPASGFDAETRARIDCAEQFDETGTHLSDCPRAHPQEGGATGMSESTLAGQFCAHLHVEWHTRDDGNLTVGWWECAVCPQHFVPFTEDLIRTVAALTAENERLREDVRCLQRFECTTGGCGDPECCGSYGTMEPDAAGEWVRHADIVAALTAENERQAKAISFAVGWLGAMLERRQYEDAHELREMQDMLVATQVVEVKQHG